jgi:hypothetical protein
MTLKRPQVKRQRRDLRPPADDLLQHRVPVLTLSTALAALRAPEAKRDAESEASPANGGDGLHGTLGGQLAGVGEGIAQSAEPIETMAGGWR